MSSSTRKKATHAHRILIVGESCRDIFLYCQAERLAPDIPAPVLRVLGKRVNPGMAKNVERNVRQIYKYCDLVTNPDWRRITKTRYVHEPSNHHFVRVDTDHHISRIAVKHLPLTQYRLVAISDYNKGFLSEEDIEYICRNHTNVFIDTKKVLGKWAARAKFIKINNYEYERSKPFLSDSLLTKVIYTKGGQGAFFQGVHYPVDAVRVKDASGAGDSFFAALLVEYLKTGDIRKSIEFANACASKVVQQPGVTTIERSRAIDRGV